MEKLRREGKTGEGFVGSVQAEGSQKRVKVAALLWIVFPTTRRGRGHMC